MATLRDIRDASAAYFATKIVTTVGVYTPTGASINVGETFSFNITAQNAGAADGVQIKNVRYHVSSSNPAIVKLIVPPATVGTVSSGALPGSEVNGYTLTPALGDPKTLTPGESDSITGLTATAKAMGAFTITMHVHGDIDLDYLFPANQTNPNGSRAGNVLE